MIPQPQAEFLVFYRASLENAVDLMKACLESAERLQKQQLCALREALNQHVQSVSALAEAKSLEDLVALQQKMASGQFERVMVQARDWFNQTYALTARATEEAAQLAVAQAGVRRTAPAPQPERKIA